MTAETSNARGELRMADIREDAREPLQLLREKLAHDEDGWAALCQLMPMLAAAPPPAAAQQGQAVAECHCGTCTCNPNMTPAVRFDLSPAQKEGAIRDHLIALGWTPPGAQQPAAVDRARFRKAPCYLCGYNGAGYFQPETHPCAALYHAAPNQEPKS